MPGENRKIVTLREIGKAAEAYATRDKFDREPYRSRYIYSFVKVVWLAHEINRHNVDLGVIARDSFVKDNYILYGDIVAGATASYFMRERERHESAKHEARLMIEETRKTDAEATAAASAYMEEQGSIWIEIEKKRS